ncbi:15287_t:CDS:1, partial [Acaulospora morrowiae]
ETRFFFLFVSIINPPSEWKPASLIVVKNSLNIDERMEDHYRMDDPNTLWLASYL